MSGASDNSSVLGLVVFVHEGEELGSVKPAAARWQESFVLELIEPRPIFGAEKLDGQFISAFALPFRALETLHNTDKTRVFRRSRLK